jgi:hypothetical protein
VIKPEEPNIRFSSTVPASPLTISRAALLSSMMREIVVNGEMDHAF